MKRTAMIGVALACLLAGPTVYAAGSSTQGAGAKHQHKAMKKMAHHGMSMAHAEDIQKALNAHGAKLKVDGKLGKETRVAIKDYQKANGLKATGYANKKTREKLGLKF